MPNVSKSDFQTPQTPTSGATKASVAINENNPFAQHDYGIIIRAFEVETSRQERVDYVVAPHYRDVYSTRNFSYRVQEQLQFYPGMHQALNSNPQNADPLYVEAKKKSEQDLQYWQTSLESPAAFEQALRQNQGTFDHSVIFGTDASARERAKEIGKLLTECIPCFGRIIDGSQLLPDGDLLEVHALNIKIKTDLLDKISSLFNNPGLSVNICELLRLFSHLCPSDLLALTVLLSQYLAKLSLDFTFNLDFIIQLVGPLLSPFLDALSQWLDRWVQLILGPGICLLDHINATLLTAQGFQMPFSSVTGNVSGDLGFAVPAHKNASSQVAAGTASQSDDASSNAWAGWQWEQFNTPSSEKYNSKQPEPPREETELAMQELSSSWGEPVSEAERAERDAKWAELKAREEQKNLKVPPPLRTSNPKDGTRWSKDEIPDSEKYKKGGSYQTGYFPPEKQNQSARQEFIISPPLINSILQLRNVTQGAIAYIKDWFEYVTQMVYDLLGTDAGWMDKKVQNTMSRSNIIEIINLLRAILGAVSKNGLECGENTNLDITQVKYIFETEMNAISENSFVVDEDGTIHITTPGSGVNTVDNSTSETSETIESTTPDSSIEGLVPGGEIQPTSVPGTIENQKPATIVIKDCLRNVKANELEKVKNWIADFEVR